MEDKSHMGAAACVLKFHLLNKRNSRHLGEKIPYKISSLSSFHQNHLFDAVWSSLLVKSFIMIAVLVLAFLRQLASQGQVEESFTHEFPIPL